MKQTIIYILPIVLLFISCNQKKETAQKALAFTETTDSAGNTITVNKKVADTAKLEIINFKKGDFSLYETNAYIQMYINDSLVDTIDEDSYSMMSWHNTSSDTTLVVHPEFGFGASASLLIRFVNDSAKVMLLAAAHDPRPMFKLYLKDSFTSHIEVPAKRYRLQLSEIPDTTTKQIIYGYIDMESEDYYRKTTAEEKAEYQLAKEIKYRTSLKFYFRSQYDHSANQQ